MKKLTLTIGTPTNEYNAEIRDTDGVLWAQRAVMNNDDEKVMRVMAASTELLEAVRSAHHMLTRDYIDPEKMAVVEKCSSAYEQATGEEL